MRAAVARPTARRKRTWTQDPEGRRARILETAARIFARRGYRAARMDENAKESAVAEGTVYHQFTSRVHLLAAVGDRYGKGFAAAASSHQVYSNRGGESNGPGLDIASRVAEDGSLGSITIGLSPAKLPDHFRRAQARS